QGRSGLSGAMHGFVWPVDTAEYARCTSWSCNLGRSVKAMLKWRGKRGMHWDRFLESAFQVLSDVSRAMWLVNLGGNDLAQWSGKSLILQVKDDLQSHTEWFPHMFIAWFDIIPPQILKQTDKAHEQVNRETGNIVRLQGGSVISHPRWDDGVHLSEPSFDILLVDLQGGLQAALGGL
ncbi:hypothetical protein JRQ81_008290, partial [Phrynocephalus forsythii]